MKKNRELLIEQILIDNYEQYYKLAYSHIHVEADALDVVQEGAYKAILRCDSLKEEKYAQTWVYRIMLNEVYDFLRKKMGAERQLAQLPDAEGETLEIAERLSLREAIENLSEDERKLVHLRFFEDYKLEEIAIILDENLSTVKSRLYRTLRKLKISI